SVCVEICSAAFFLDDDPGVLVSACLFGDGAAAAILTREPNPDKRRIVWKAGWTRLSAVDRDHLRFEQQNGLLRNILAKQVPELAAEHVERVLQTGLAEQNLSSEQIAAWIFHSGGKAILSAVRDRLRLPDSALDWSARVLREYGNLSSPCVLF